MSGLHEQDSRRYRFRIRGHLGASTLSAFAEMETEQDGADTLLTASLPDRAALYGAIAQFERLGLELLGIRLLNGDDADF
jgi:hypothetical protein